MELTWDYGIWGNRELGRVLLQTEARPLDGPRGR